MSKSGVAKSERAIKQRLGNFVKDATTSSRELGNALSSLRSIGDVVIFGGAIRDIALFGVEKFRSDIDLVIDIEDHRAIEIALRRHEYRMTAFGGYRLRIDSWQVDVWPYKRTWAVTRGHVHASRLEDLIRTTFFNWDAALYSLESKKLTLRPDYIDVLHKRYLDVVLPNNPNPLGMVERTLRLMMRTGATLSPTLVQFVLQTLNDKNTDVVSRKAWIGDIPALLRALKLHYGRMPECPFVPEAELPLEYSMRLGAKNVDHMR